MIISFYTSKGGASKTSSALALLSAIAEHNARSSKHKLRTLALDLDSAQGSLTKFAESRLHKSKPSYDIEFHTINSSIFTSTILTKRAANYDLTIVDAPGYHDDQILKAVSISDAVVVPCNLSVIEYVEANDSLNRIYQIRHDVGIEGHLGILLTRTEQIPNMTTKFSRALFKQILGSGHAFYDAKLSTLNAYQMQMDHGSYLFEFMEDAGKGVQRALLESRTALRSISEGKFIEDNDMLTAPQILARMGSVAEGN